MGTFFDAVKRAAKAAVGQLPSKFTVSNKAVVCPHCDGQESMEGRVVVRPALMPLLHLDWLQSAYLLTCAECGRIEWFAIEPPRLDG